MGVAMNTEKDFTQFCICFEIVNEKATFLTESTESDLRVTEGGSAHPPPSIGS